MRKYEAYVDYEEEWIGSVPEHWKLKKVKHTTYVKGRIGWNGLRSDEFLEMSDSIVVTGTDFNNGLINWKTCYQINQARYDEDLFIQLKENDLLITKDGTIGKVALVIGMPKICTLNSGVFVTRPITGDYISKYMYWLLISDVFTSFFNYNKSGSTIQHLYQNVFDEFKFPCPPIIEQTTIANYLDHKTSQLDTLIRKKEKLIELLREERTAIINQAVTKGLNPDVPMRDSGIEWLGEIPEKWEIWKLSHAFEKVGSGTTPESGNPKYHENGIYNWLNTGDLNNGYLDSVSKKVTEQALKDYSALKLFPTRTVVIAMYGATIGKTSIVNCEVTVNQACCVFYGSSTILNEFLFYWFIAKKDHIVNLSKGGGQPNISQDILKGIKIPCPEKEEQLEIVRFIENESKRVTTIISKIEQEIELLKEYKTALISEVVTGKLDVRSEL